MKTLLHPIVISTFIFSIVASGPSFAQRTQRVSISSQGAEGNEASEYPSISGDGVCVVFESWADNLVPEDNNGMKEIFIHNRQTRVTQRISVSSSGAAGNNYSFSPSISSDGRYVAFGSSANNLVLGDTNGFKDIFVHDCQTGATERVSVDSQGIETNANSYSPSISRDGRFVAFASNATNLIQGDTNKDTDIFVHDRLTGEVERVSVSSQGGQGQGKWVGSWDPSISADGRFVAFMSTAAGLIAGDSNPGGEDVFVHDRQTGVTELVSKDSQGNKNKGHSRSPSISADGRFVAFSSRGAYVPGDSNSAFDIFVHDRDTRMTERVSVSSTGDQAPRKGHSRTPSISADGRLVAFRSQAANLVPGDTNSAWDVFVHDRQTAATERVSVNSQGEQGKSDCLNPSISADGGSVAFEGNGPKLVPGDSNWVSDAFVHDLWDRREVNTILLVGPSTASVGVPLDLSWSNAEARSSYALLYSSNLDGSIIGRQLFDIGAPVTFLATGANSLDGEGSFQSAPVPSSAAGFTFYFEVAAIAGLGIVRDSNVLTIEFF